jgi:Ran GTPase-activating protein (RanGAP) involved in mRNA processing and transport
MFDFGKQSDSLKARSRTSGGTDMVSRQGTRAAKGREAEKKEKDLAFAVLVGKVETGNVLDVQVAGQLQTAQDGREIATALKSPECIVKLFDMKGNGANFEVARALADSLRVSHSLRTVDLSDNPFGPKGVQAIAKALVENESVTWLDVSMCHAGGHEQVHSAAARALGEMCKENLSVKTLDVGYNGFPGGDVVHIAKGLAGNTTLTSFDVGGNLLALADCQALCETLRRNRGLVHLDLRNTGLNEASLAIVLSALHTKKVAEQPAGLHGRAGSPPRRGAQPVKDGGEKDYNVTLRSLNISDNIFGFSGVISVQRLIRGNKFLTNLDVALNLFGVKGAAMVAEALRANHTLTALDLTGCHMGDSAKLIEEARGENLVRLEL